MADKPEPMRFSLVLAGEFTFPRAEAVERAIEAFKALGATEGRFVTYENQFSPNGTDLRLLVLNELAAEQAAAGVAGDEGGTGKPPEAPVTTPKKRARKATKK